MALPTEKNTENPGKNTINVINPLVWKMMFSIEMAILGGCSHFFRHPQIKDAPGLRLLRKAMTLIFATQELLERSGRGGWSWAQLKLIH